MEGEFDRRIPMMIISNKKELKLPTKNGVLEESVVIIKRKFIRVDD